MKSRPGAEKDRDLQRKCEFAVQILMQAIKIAGRVLQQQGCRARLAFRVTLLQEVGMPRGIAGNDTHALVPVVCDTHQMTVKRGAQPGEQIRKGIPEVAVLAFAEAVPRHVYMAPEVTFVRIETCYPAAFVRREKLLDDRTAVRVKLSGQTGPVIRGDAPFGQFGKRHCGADSGTGVHGRLSPGICPRPTGQMDFPAARSGTQKRAGDLHLCDPRAKSHPIPAARAEFRVLL